MVLAVAFAFPRDCLLGSNGAVAFAFRGHHPSHLVAFHRNPSSATTMPTPR
jgi:hypothetical protein